MENKENQEVNDESFEAGLRDILSYGSRGGDEGPVSSPNPAPRGGNEPPTPEDFAARFRREEKIPFWVHFIRPAALLTLLGLMLLYVYRVFLN